MSLKKLRTKEMTTEELLLSRLIKELYGRDEKIKCWNNFKHGIILDACIEFLQQMELIDQFNTTQKNAHVFQVNKFKRKEKFDICRYYNMRHKRDRNKCSAFGQVCRS